MQRKTVLILGANGRFGIAAAQAFDAAGWRVLAQVRRGVAPAMPRAAVPLRIPLVSPLVSPLASPLRGRHTGRTVGTTDGTTDCRTDCTTAGMPADTAALVREAAGASVVVYAVNPLYTEWDAQMLPLAHAGMDAAQALGATFMLPGNVYNFGADMPALLTEQTPEAPTTPKGRLRCALEAELALHARSGRLRSIVVRAGDFYGGGAGSWFDQVIVKSIAAGKLVYPGPLDRPHAWAYLPDLAASFVALADACGLGAFERFHFPGHTVTGGELLDAVERAAGRLGLEPARGRWRRGTLPWRLIRAVAWAVPMWRELLTMEYLWRLPHALDGRRLAQVIGRRPATPLDDAVRASLRPFVPAGAAHAFAVR